MHAGCTLVRRTPQEEQHGARTHGGVGRTDRRAQQVRGAGTTTELRAVEHAEPLRRLDRRRRRPARHRLDGRRGRRSSRRPRLARGDQARGRRTGRSLPRRAGRRVHGGHEGCGRDAAVVRRRGMGRRLAGWIRRDPRRRCRSALVRHVAARQRHPRRARPQAGDRLGIAGRDLARRGISDGSPTGRATCRRPTKHAYAFILAATGRADGSSLGADAPPNIYATITFPPLGTGGRGVSRPGRSGRRRRAARRR